MKAIQSIPELYAHAIAIEGEAAQRYAEFAERMDDLGNDALAELFARLSGFEAAHLDALREAAAGLDLAAIEPGDYRWLDAGAPETAARELVFRLMTPRHALHIALAAERRAQAFFERVVMTAREPALRRLGEEMALEEQEHAGLIERLLARTPESHPDWNAVSENETRGAHNV